MKVSQVFFILGISFATIGTIACILAFGLPSWLYTYDDDSNQGIDNAGLWVFCLETFFDYRQRTQGSKPCNNQGNSRDLSCFNGGVPMYGCHWIYSDDLESIRWTILNPGMHYDNDNVLLKSYSEKLIHLGFRLDYGL